jgi:hypothetical protein
MMPVQGKHSVDGEIALFLCKCLQTIWNAVVRRRLMTRRAE